MNRLGGELSPYLQQHAHNPVDWYPWGDEALARARREDRPILLSIGYSACHWCHVMERESFDDPETAELMNRLFVNIKVDREERPDLDQIYQLTIPLLTRQSGGWPLTVFLLPDLQPFYAGTYYPPEDRFGRPGFRRVLLAVDEAYRSRRADVDRRAAELTRAIATVTTASGDPSEPPPDAARRAARAALRRYDARHGGFGDRPKFPSTMTVEVLLRAHLRGEPEMLQRVRQTLDGMRQGGIHEQLGGGFLRYSTDERWLVPHFERMLYDNALLARRYVDGWRATGDEAYRETARGVLAYV
ncbi:MAG: thioredoxin domain-containing protein, partial [Sandaracinaceae bacterium]